MPRRGGAVRPRGRVGSTHSGPGEAAGEAPTRARGRRFDAEFVPNTSDDEARYAYSAQVPAAGRAATLGHAALRGGWRKWFGKASVRGAAALTPAPQRSRGSAPGMCCGSSTRSRRSLMSPPRASAGWCAARRRAGAASRGGRTAPQAVARWMHVRTWSCLSIQYQGKISIIVTLDNPISGGPGRGVVLGCVPPAPAALLP